MPTYSSKWPEYAQQWDSIKILPSKKSTLTAVARRLIASKDRYLKAEKLTGVPWYMIAVIHERESSQNWNTQLAQGDPLNRKSTHIPRGRGPFTTWEQGAYDALVTLKSFNKIIDWRLEKILYYLELYNGWGYHNHQVPSAYLWAGSSVYRGGKYVADGVWSSTAQDVQPGCASLLKIMVELDPSIKPKRETKGIDPTIVSGTVAAGATATIWYNNPEAWILIASGLILTIILGYIIYKKAKHD